MTTEKEYLRTELDEVLAQISDILDHMLGTSENGTPGGCSPPVDFSALDAELKILHAREMGIRAKLLGKSVDDYRVWLSETDEGLNLDPSYRQHTFARPSQGGPCFIYGAADKKTGFPVLVIVCSEDGMVCTLGLHQAARTLHHDDWAFAKRSLTTDERTAIRNALVSWVAFIREGNPDEV